MPQDIVEISSEVTHESGKTFDSQETISDKTMYFDFLPTQTPDNSVFEKRFHLSACFPGVLEFGNTKFFWNPASRMFIL